MQNATGTKALASNDIAQDMDSCVAFVKLKELKELKAWKEWRMVAQLLSKFISI